MSGPAVFGTHPYASKLPVEGRVVAVLRGVTDARGLWLTAFRSRAVRRGEIHELMISDEDAPTESTVNRVALLAFFEVTSAGVLLIDDTVTVGSSVVGTVAGFDETHMPNHLNVCLRGERSDGVSREIALNARVVFARD
jgi:hypothetical protein